MRKITLLKEALFAKTGEAFAPVALPHTWNALDGQDGGDDYWRGIGTYEINLPDPTPGKEQYIEIKAANHIATVLCNGTELGKHEGGFSTFRFPLTAQMRPSGNKLTVLVDNSPSHVYPQRADFTFFGGLYRDVSYIEVEPAHFDLMKHGSDAVFITAYSGGITRADVFPVNCDGCTVKLELQDAEGNTVFSAERAAEPHTHFNAVVKKARLWQGLEDPYCYQAIVTLLREEQELDRVEVTYGYRSFRVDAEHGFFLNGKSTPLHGVCRHQDRENKGWAISRSDMEEDAALIKEIGANTVRLAHYQHDQYFYDLCDKIGFAVWAEIPYISTHMHGQASYDNTISQMTELIAQSYNHPSIIVWGISNEITIYDINEAQYRNLCDLHALAKRMDPSRLTTMAQLSRLPYTNTQTQITDVQSYNIYYGWYVGALEDNGRIMDKFHAMHPDRAYGVSEYGVEDIPLWHSATPFCHDYTEEYANRYHHEMLKAFAQRPYLWATHVWNMFDFAADLRNEGGIAGRNNKGLMHYDHKTKKDAFYIYQAFWTKEPMVHIASRLFANRAPGERDVTVYTNCDSVTLELNGKPYMTLPVTDHAAVFPEVPLQDGENTLTAVAGQVSDTISLWGVANHDSKYDLPDLASALQAGNWFSEDEETPDYGEQGHNADMPFKILLTNPQTLQIVTGWVMSKTAIPTEERFRFVAGLSRWGFNENYNFRNLRMMAIITEYMTEEDFQALDQRLRSVKYEA